MPLKPLPELRLSLAGGSTLRATETAIGPITGRSETGRGRGRDPTVRIAATAEADRRIGCVAATAALGRVTAMPSGDRTAIA